MTSQTANIPLTWLDPDTRLATNFLITYFIYYYDFTTTCTGHQILVPDWGHKTSVMIFWSSLTCCIRLAKRTNFSVFPLISICVFQLISINKGNAKCSITYLTYAYDLDLWPQKSIGFILSSWLTSPHGWHVCQVWWRGTYTSV